MSLVGSKENGLNYALIRDTFQRAVEYFSPQLVSTDDLLRLHAYWARLEATLGQDIVAARGVWESLIKKREVHDEANEGRQKAKTVKLHRQEQEAARKEKLRQAYLRKQLEKLTSANLSAATENC